MFKYLLILTLGIAIGYGYGWKDARLNTLNVAERLVERIGGSNRDTQESSANIDARMRAAESR